jgi:hypothetical protein
MLGQLLVGGIVSLCNIAIHSLVMTAIVQVSRKAAAKHVTRPSLRLTRVMIVVVLVLMAAHVIEVFVWALAYLITGAASSGWSRLLYFAFVNYTTLGYGDITPVEEWELLGPLTAMNGVILFGWSTAVIFTVLQKTMAGLLEGADQARTRDDARSKMTAVPAAASLPTQTFTITDIASTIAAAPTCLSAANDRHGLLTAVGPRNRYGLRGAAGIIDDWSRRRRRYRRAFIEAGRVSVRPVPRNIELIGVIVISIARYRLCEFEVGLAIPWSPKRDSSERPERTCITSEMATMRSRERPNERRVRRTSSRTRRCC